MSLRLEIPTGLTPDQFLQTLNERMRQIQDAIDKQTFTNAGGARIQNVGDAAADTDALNRISADRRYLGGSADAGLAARVAALERRPAGSTTIVQQSVTGGSTPPVTLESLTLPSGAGTTTVSAVAAPVNGYLLRIRVIQNADGNRKITFAANLINASTSALNRQANKVTDFWFVGVGSNWEFSHSWIQP